MDEHGCTMNVVILMYRPVSGTRIERRTLVNVLQRRRRIVGTRSKRFEGDGSRFTSLSNVHETSSRLATVDVKQ